MAQPVRFPYASTDTTAASLMPRLPLTLTYEQRSVEVVGLLDTGAAVNVLPYPVGLALGLEYLDERNAFLVVAKALVEIAGVAVRHTGFEGDEAVVLRSPPRLRSCYKCPPHALAFCLLGHDEFSDVGLLRAGEMALPADAHETHTLPLGILSDEHSLVRSDSGNGSFDPTARSG